MKIDAIKIWEDVFTDAFIEANDRMPTEEEVEEAFRKIDFDDVKANWILSNFIGCVD